MRSGNPSEAPEAWIRSKPVKPPDPPRLGPGGQAGEARGHARLSTRSSGGPDRQTDTRRGAVGVLVIEREPAVPRAPDSSPGKRARYHATALGAVEGWRAN